VPRLTAKQKAEARLLGMELRDLIENHFGEASNEKIHMKIKAIRAALKDIGIAVCWSVKINPETLKFDIKVILYIPQYLH